MDKLERQLWSYTNLGQSARQSDTLPNTVAHDLSHYKHKALLSTLSEVTKG